MLQRFKLWLSDSTLAESIEWFSNRRGAQVNDDYANAYARGMRDNSRDQGVNVVASVDYLTNTPSTYEPACRSLKDSGVNIIVVVAWDQDLPEILRICKRVGLWGQGYAWISADAASASSSLASGANHGQTPAETASLLDEQGAWLIGMAIGPHQDGAARAWRCLYSSSDHGLSMNRFAHHASGYGGPTLLLAHTEHGETVGGYVDAPWKAGTKYFGGQDCFLFTLAPSFHVYRAAATGSNYAFFNPPKTGTLRGGHYGAEAIPEVFGFGGQPVRLRLGLEDDVNQLVWHNSDTSFALHPDAGGALPEGPRRVRQLEVWGCGGADAEAAQRLLKERQARDTARAGKVDRAAMFGGGGGGDWRDGNNPDKMILETAGAHTFYSDRLDKLPPDAAKR